MSCLLFAAFNAIFILVMIFIIFVSNHVDPFLRFLKMRVPVLILSSQEKYLSEVFPLSLGNSSDIPFSFCLLRIVFFHCPFPLRGISARLCGASSGLAGVLEGQFRLSCRLPSTRAGTPVPLSCTPACRHPLPRSLFLWVTQRSTSLIVDGLFFSDFSFC